MKIWKSSTRICGSGFFLWHINLFSWEHQDLLDFTLIWYVFAYETKFLIYPISPYICESYSIYLSFWWFLIPPRCCVHQVSGLLLWNNEIMLSVLLSHYEQIIPGFSYALETIWDFIREGHSLSVGLIQWRTLTCKALVICIHILNKIPQKGNKK